MGMHTTGTINLHLQVKNKRVSCTMDPFTTGSDNICKHEQLLFKEAAQKILECIAVDKTNNYNIRYTVSTIFVFTFFLLLQRSQNTTRRLEAHQESLKITAWYDSNEFKKNY